jgi:hypothetical protein
MLDATLAPGLLLATLAVWLILPLLPAILIYRLFPNTVVALQGPLQGLTLSAGGAFAAYVVVLLVSAAAVYQIIGTIRHPPTTTWALKAGLQVQDENGRSVPTPKDDVTVSLDPSPVTVSGDSFRANIKREPSGWPTIRVEVDGYGAKTFVLDPDRLSFAVDENRYLVEIKEPLVIRRPAPVSAGDPAAFETAEAVSP